MVGTTAGPATPSGLTVTTTLARASVSPLPGNAPSSPDTARCHVARTGPVQSLPTSMAPRLMSTTTSSAAGGCAAGAPVGRLPKRSDDHGIDVRVAVTASMALSRSSGGLAAGSASASGCVAAIVQFIPIVISPDAASASSTR